MLILFKQTRVTTHYWDFIELASEKKVKNYKSADAVCAWCLKCNVEVDFVTGSLAGVKSHLRDKHPGHMKKSDDSKTDKSSIGSGRSKQTSLEDTFATAAKPYMKKVLPADQKRGEALLVYWIVNSLRAFKIVEDEGFIKFCEFLNNLNSKFTITRRTRISKQVTKLNKAVSINVKYKLMDEMDCFCITTDIWTSRTMEGFMAVTIHYVDSDFRMKEFVLEVRQFGQAHTANNIR